jgi:esterase/lipase
MKNIILLHGAIGAADQLEPLANALKEKQFKVHCFSFSGHGNTPFQNAFSIEQFASELAQFIKDHQLEQAAVFGYSMGGYVALHLAKTKPGLLGNIITLGTKFAWSPEIAQKEVKMLDANTISEKVPKFAETLKNRHGGDWETLLQKTADMMLGLGNDPALKESDFTAIENKVLIGLADHDTMVTMDETVTVFKQLKQGNMYVLPGSKHPIETINVKLLSEILENYLK